VKLIKQIDTTRCLLFLFIKNAYVWIVFYFNWKLCDFEQTALCWRIRRCHINTNERLFIPTNLVYVIVIKSWSVNRVKYANERQRWKHEIITSTWESCNEHLDDRIISSTDFYRFNEFPIRDYSLIDTNYCDNYVLCSQGHLLFIMMWHNTSTMYDIDNINPYIY